MRSTLAKLKFTANAEESEEREVPSCCRSFGERRRFLTCVTFIKVQRVCFLKKTKMKYFILMYMSLKVRLWFMCSHINNTLISTDKAKGIFTSVTKNAGKSMQTRGRKNKQNYTFTCHKDSSWFFQFKYLTFLNQDTFTWEGKWQFKSWFMKKDQI